MWLAINSVKFIHMNTYHVRVRVPQGFATEYVNSLRQRARKRDAERKAEAETTTWFKNQVESHPTKWKRL